MNNIVAAPKRSRYQLVFDVETTGLLPKQSKLNPQLTINDYPHITQLSFVLYDIVEKKVIQTFDNFIQLPSTVQISDEVTKITGITWDICNQGIPIVDALIEFYKAYSICDGIVAHNLDFDEKVIMIELERNVESIVEIEPRCLSLFRSVFEELKGMERYCTMRKGSALCNILVEPTQDGKVPRVKWPKLSELYVKLFQEPAPEGLHNAMVDVTACLKCYLKMRHNTAIV
uniref:Exonuclease domain-containing protein n=1 Tax=viral metagenome TaxID=1070528 RepID=A0A6C0I349_9ZZZZ